MQPLQRDERKQHSSRRVNKNKDGARGTHTWRPQQRIRAEAHCRLPTAWLCLSTHTRLARKPRGAPGSPSQRSGVWKKVCDLLWAPFYIHFYFLWKHQLFSSVQSLSRVRLCNPMNCSTGGLPVQHQLPKFTQTHVHRVSGAIQPPQPLSSPSPPAPNPSQHQGLFQ